MILILFVIIIFLVFVKNLGIKKINNLINITEINVINNDTTIPDNVIRNTLKDRIKNIFDILVIEKYLKKKFSEIEKVEIKNIPFFSKNLRISLKSREFLFYMIKYGKIIFCSKDTKFYSVYSPYKLLESNNFIEVELEKFSEIKDVADIINKLNRKVFTDNIKKIVVKNNDQYILETYGNNKIILRGDYQEVDLKKVKAVGDFLIGQKGIMVDCSYLGDDIVYFRSLASVE
ncbi:MAG: hypothetical protein N2643_03370 [Endomicrobia bacterium]|nr:hypothetical protein [Endomicrobiia bacterium]